MCIFNPVSPRTWDSRPSPLLSALLEEQDRCWMKSEGGESLEEIIYPWRLETCEYPEYVLGTTKAYTAAKITFEEDVGEIHALCCW
jgi:hypothetical protein